MTPRPTNRQLLLSGDIETNPGPTGRRSVAQGPSTEEQLFTLNTQVKNEIFLQKVSKNLMFD